MLQNSAEDPAYVYHGIKQAYVYHGIEHDNFL